LIGQVFLAKQNFKAEHERGGRKADGKFQKGEIDSPEKAVRASIVQDYKT